MNECRAGGELPLLCDLMSKAQIRPFPNVGAVGPRIPSLDSCGADFILYNDCSAHSRTGHGHVLLICGPNTETVGAQMDRLVFVPNVQVVDKGVRGKWTLLAGEPDLDRGVVTHQLVLSGQNELVHLREFTKSLQTSSGSSASSTKAQRRWSWWTLEVVGMVGSALRVVVVVRGALAHRELVALVFEDLAFGTKSLSVRGLVFPST